MLPLLLDDYLTLPELAKQLGVCTMTVWRWRSRGLGPAHVKLGRKVLYRRLTVAAWIAAQERAAA